MVLELVMVIHEYGHFTEMRKMNIEVEEFSLGIGPVLYQHHAPGYTFSIRAIPVMAYVAPSKKGGEKIEKELSRFERFFIYSAGVRNNILSAVFVAVMFQLLAVARGYISFGYFWRMLLLLPPDLLFLFLASFVDLLSFNKIRLYHQPVMTGGIIPPKSLRLFMMISVLLGVWNSAPFVPLDGSKIFLDILPLFVSPGAVARYASFSFYIFIFYLFAAGRGIKFFEFE